MLPASTPPPEDEGILETDHKAWALHYANENHWSVFPLAERQKIPLSGSHGFKDASVDISQIESWWTQNPKYNIGVSTGRVSGIVVVDIDPKSGGSFAALEAAYGPIPPTLVQRTGGGGLQLFFNYPEVVDCIKCSESELAEGIDVRGDGGYAAVPPSIHPKPKDPNQPRYRWHNELPLADLSEKLLKAMLDGKRRDKKVEASTKFKNSKRNGGLCGLAGGMRRAGMSAQEIRVAILQANQDRCEPPLNESELEKTVLSSASKWQQGEVKEERKRITVKNASELAAMELPELKWIAKGLIPAEGVTMIAGRPKAKKSFLGLQLALDYARGTGKFLNWFDIHATGRVLFFGLEDSQRRLQDRQRRLGSDAEGLKQIDYADGLKLDREGTEELIGLLRTAQEENRPYKLIVIDPFLTAAPQRSGKADPIRADYAEIENLKQVSEEFGAPIVIINHTRKEARGDDMLSLASVLGTTGVTASVDTILILGKTSDDDAVLAAKGKDVNEQVYEMDFELYDDKEGEHKGWWVTGTSQAKLKGDRKKVIEFIGDETSKEAEFGQLVTALGKAPQAVSNLLGRMVKEAHIRKLDKGRYALIDPDEKPKPEPSAPSQNFEGLGVAEDPAKTYQEPPF